MINLAQYLKAIYGSGATVGLALLITLLHADVALSTTRSHQVDSPAQPETLAELIATAEQQGTVRVLLSLDTGVTTRSPSQLPVFGRHLQRLRVVQASLSVEQSQPQWSDQIIRRYRHLPVLALNATADDLRALSELPQVSHIHLDRPLQRTLSQSGAVIGVPQLRQQGLDGSGQVIVVMDDGIDRAHPFFNNPDGESRIIDGACFSAQGVDNSSNLTPLCAGGTTTEFGPQAADISNVAACIVNGNNLCDHGTHVAGIAAGWSADLEGVASNADIIPMQVFTRIDFKNSNGFDFISFNSDLLAALQHVEDLLVGNPALHIAAINMSLGDSSNVSDHCDTFVPAITAAIERLRDAGVATVIASGNDGHFDGMSFPACISHAIAVASTDKNDEVSSFSNVSGLTDLFAPGGNFAPGGAILSAVPNEMYGAKRGTSMAAPQVSGAWAVLKQLKHELSVDQILAYLQTTGTPIADVEHTVPRIQIDQAATSILNLWQSENVIFLDRFETPP